MQRVGMIVLLVVAILPIVALSARAESVEIVFDRDADRLGLQVSEAPLPLLMGRLAEVTGIGFQLDGSLSEDRASLNRTPVGTEEALRELLRRYSHILYYGRDAQGRVRIQSVVVLAREGKTSSSSSLLEFPAISGMARLMDVTGAMPSVGATASPAAVNPSPVPPAANTASDYFSGGGNGPRPERQPVEPPPPQSAPLSADHAY